MTDSFAAQPGTFVLVYNSEEPTARKMIPVVGWQKGLSGFDPITVVAEDGRMIFGKAVLIWNAETGSEFVTDPTSKMTFDDVDDWLAYMKGAKPVAKPNAETGIRRRVNLFIQFGKKEYVNKSFWHFKTPSDEFLFTLEGGMEAPEDARVTKINRDTFFNARKLLEVVPFDDLFNTSVGSAPEPDEDDEIEGLI